MPRAKTQTHLPIDLTLVMRDISYDRSKPGKNRKSTGGEILWNREIGSIYVLTFKTFYITLYIPWQQDVLLPIAAEYMSIAVELVGSQGMQEILELYNTGLYPATAYVARLRAVYIDPTKSPETFTPLFVDVR
ncbi:MAG: hypothetical protein QXQ57_03475 [Sulfolobales archaeon]